MRLTLSIFSIFLMLPIFGCSGDGDSTDLDYRREMREFVQSISAFAKAITAAFVVIPQNGQELITADGEPDGILDVRYVSAIDGIGREDLFYGYQEDNKPTPAAEKVYMTGFLDKAEIAGLEVLVADYCWTQPYVDDSYTESAGRAYISFAADRRYLDRIPSYPASPFNVNTSDISTLSQAKNFIA